MGGCSSKCNITEVNVGRMFDYLIQNPTALANLVDLVTNGVYFDRLCDMIATLSPNDQRSVHYFMIMMLRNTSQTFLSHCDVPVPEPPPVIEEQSRQPVACRSPFGLSRTPLSRCTVHEPIPEPSRAPVMKEQSKQQVACGSPCAEPVRAHVPWICPPVPPQNLPPVRAHVPWICPPVPLTITMNSHPTRPPRPPVSPHNLPPVPQQNLPQNLLPVPCSSDDYDEFS